MTNTERTVVVATPHPRYDVVDQMLSEHGHQVHRVRRREDLTVERLAAIAPDWALFPHWSYRIPAEIHQQFRCVIFHMTDVPYGRGGSPLQNLIVRGHADTVMSAMQCVEEMDAGDVYLKRPLALHGTGEEIFQRAAALIAAMSVELVETEPDAVPQTGPVTTFTRRTPADSVIRGDESLDELFDLIRMLDADGYPHAYVQVGRLRFEFVNATRGEDGRLRADVTIIDHGDEDT